ncbi:MAG: alr [Amycolatopsis sp.]|nr:alr [Amycolatopsis sp.]
MAEVTVDLAAIGRNTAVIAGEAGVPVMAVVTADGFGHGMLPVAKAALDHGAGWLGVAFAAEALELRAGGITAPILSWLHGHDQDFCGLIEADVDISAGSVEHLVGIAACASQLGVTAKVQLKIDTGLGRGGCTPAEWPSFVLLARRLEREGLVLIRGIWSDLVADDAAEHVARFERALAYAGTSGLRPQWCHVANSAAGLGVPASRFDLVRAGIGLYGVEPVEGRDVGLRGAMTVTGRIVGLKESRPGAEACRDFPATSTRSRTRGLVPLGFAHGIPRAASRRAQVQIGGRRHRTADWIMMDQFAVEAGAHGVALGDEVVLFGPGDRGEPTVSDWARWAGTVPHEIFAGIGSRIPRRYLSDVEAELVSAARA